MKKEESKKDTESVLCVRVDDRFDQKFLYTLACEEGLDVWVKPNSHTRVYFQATDRQVKDLLKRAEAAFGILIYRRRELIAEVMLYAGSKNKDWPQVIGQAQANISVFPSSWKVSTNFSGVPRTSRKWTKKILFPKCRMAAGRWSVIKVKLP